MDKISFSYWKKNYSVDKPKTYSCIHNGYTYGENMDINSFSFIYLDNGIEKSIHSENNSLKKAYLSFLAVICNKSEQAFNNFRNTSDKYKIFNEDEKNKFETSQIGSTRLNELVIRNQTYYVATNLKVSEYIFNIAERLPENELDNYFMQLTNNQNLMEKKMGKRDPNQIYIRRIATNHDLTHEINIGKPALNNFFEGNLHPVFHSKKNPLQKYQIDINSSDDDPRFGKQVYDFLNDEGGVEIGDLFVVYKANKQDYFAEIVKTTDKEFSFYNHFYDNADSNERHTFVYADEPKDLFEAAEQESNEYIKNFSQIIYYGVPGSGKSFKIDKTIDSVNPEQKMRVVFHPEYTNADFIGQILPIEDNGVDYRFKAGPFTRILKRALQNPSKPYYLVIEEINRGNAAAIFGDLFQLLDRKENGFSSYPIENIDINSFIRSKNNLHNDKIVPSTVKVGNMDFTENSEIILPPNLAIFATMNTSDQNVFTLDNAFQRRWKMELVENKFDMSNPDEAAQANTSLDKFEITWGEFQKKINNEISKQAVESGLSSMEDKRLGCWFVKPDTAIKSISTKLFSEKVLKYLWDDAFKFVRSDVFENKYQTLEDLSNAYQNGENIFKDKSFLSKNQSAIDEA